MGRTAAVPCVETGTAPNGAVPPRARALPLAATMFLVCAAIAAAPGSPRAASPASGPTSLDPRTSEPLPSRERVYAGETVQGFFDAGLPASAQGLLVRAALWGRELKGLVWQERDGRVHWTLPAPAPVPSPVPVRVQLFQVRDGVSRRSQETKVQVFPSSGSYYGPMGSVRTAGVFDPSGRVAAALARLGIRTAPMAGPEALELVPVDFLVLNAARWDELTREILAAAHKRRPRTPVLVLAPEGDAPPMAGRGPLPAGPGVPVPAVEWAFLPAEVARPSRWAGNHRLEGGWRAPPGARPLVRCGRWSMAADLTPRGSPWILASKELIEVHESEPLALWLLGRWVALLNEEGRQDSRLTGGPMGEWAWRRRS